NRLAQLASWDEKALKGELIVIGDAELEVDLTELTGFEPAEIDAIIHADDFGQQEPDPADAVLPTSPVAIVKPGDIYFIGVHKLMCGDALDPLSYSALLAEHRARVWLSDPPYNVRINGHVSGKGKVRHREFAQAVGEMSGDEFVAFLQ